MTFSFSTLIQRSVLLQVSLGLMMLVVGAHIVIPIKPVPITMQTVGALLVALSLPCQSAMVAVVSYLALGALGFPVFSAGSSGMVVLTSPVAGYLAGMVVATYVVAKLRERFAPTQWNIAAMCMIGQLCIYACGITWLTYYFNSFSAALQFGLYPFILPGAIKVAILSIAVKKLMRA